ncbi:MAG: macro domain-containing protein [Gemmatimonadetes bacterium]|nr:macro domain-containing protein [Gemmatimonadota bacterium]MBK9978464.1 macro domain-containing protein [Gemmatimonadota bacterium]
MKLSELSAEGTRRGYCTAIISDITTLSVDAIVNAANSSLAPGGGVCGAIHATAGSQLATACAHEAPCPEGEARLTAGFLLPAKYVIHAVGPRWKGGSHGEPALLASAYRAAFSLARTHGIKSIAFPAISAGIFGYPLQQATDIAVAEASAALTRGDVERVVFACFSHEVLAAYESAGVVVKP